MSLEGFFALPEEDDTPEKEITDNDDEIDYGAILDRTSRHSFVRPKESMTLAQLGIVPAKPETTPTKKDKSTNGSTTVDDEKLLNLEIDLAERRREAKKERIRTGKHIKIK